MNTFTDQLSRILIDRFGLPAETVGPDETFEQMAVDSLIIVELALVLRREYGVQLEDWDLAPEMTVREAAQFLVQKGAVAA